MNHKRSWQGNPIVKLYGENEDLRFFQVNLEVITTPEKTSEQLLNQDGPRARSLAFDFVHRGGETQKLLLEIRASKTFGIDRVYPLTSAVRKL